MPSLLPDREPDPVEPGTQTWSPRMGWRGKLAAWAILLMIAAGLIAMVALSFG